MSRIKLKPDKPEYWTAGNNYCHVTGPWVPVLPDGEAVHTFTHEELTKLLEQTYKDGYDEARMRFDIPVTTSSSNEVKIYEQKDIGARFQASLASLGIDGKNRDLLEILADVVDLLNVVKFKVDHHVEEHNTGVNN